jgi:SAM-dependent methyltransferase
MQIIESSHDAFQLIVRDPATRAYLQRHPFLMGPDPAMNASCREVILKGLSSRNREKTPTVITRLPPGETQLTEEQMYRLHQIMDNAKIPPAMRAGMIDDYAWEANLVPRYSRDVLVLGCADGPELMFLRAVLPNATITAVDYEDSIPQATQEAVGVRFFHGDMNAILANFGQEFDLISSNHTLEHLYTPNEILALLATLLRKGGALISTLPMDGMEGSPFLKKIKKVVSTKTVHPLDVVYLDAGHPWKTNPADLVATMQETGFQHPFLYQRQRHLSRAIPFGEVGFRAKLAIGRTLHAVFFACPRSLMKIIFRRSAPRIINRCLLGAERRVWFGSNLLKNIFTQEIVVLAYKTAPGPRAESR